MNKKKYMTVGGTILLFVIIIVVILLQGNKKDAWMKEVLASEDYQITMTNCSNRTTMFPKETIKELFNKWNQLSDNGPWTGDNNKCYPKVTITYSKDGIVKQQEVMLIDDSSLAINSNDGYWYYTNSSEINNYLNDLFSKY